jgi:beta-xylosidase
VADPAVMWNRNRRESWMFMTNRRAHHQGPGVEWIHGTPITVATSRDGMAWTRSHDVAGLDAPADTGLNTHWAPEVIDAEGRYHMFLSYITGAPSRFENVPRRIVHLVSADLVRWDRVGPLELSSQNVIDACVARCPDGLWRLWYKDEADGSSTWSAASGDLMDWQLEGRVIPGKNHGGNPHEGPNVFVLGGVYWMIVDEWHGQAVFRSRDAINWERQGLILDRPGEDPMDRAFARHADVVVDGDLAAIFYFTHPQWDEAAKPAPETPLERRTVIHVAQAHVADGRLIADRNAPAIALTPPSS